MINEMLDYGILALNPFPRKSLVNRAGALQATHFMLDVLWSKKLYSSEECVECVGCLDSVEPMQGRKCSLRWALWYIQP